MKGQQKQISVVSYSASLVQLNNSSQYREMESKAEFPGPKELGDPCSRNEEVHRGWRGINSLNRKVINH